jgi:hypothetical protein
VPRRHFGLPEDRELQPGVLSEDAIHVFTRGHCHSFAEAVVRLVPSAELVFAYDYCEEDGPEEDVEGHVLVKIDRRYLDARGWLDEVEREAECDVESFWSSGTGVSRRNQGDELPVAATTRNGCQ